MPFVHTLPMVFVCESKIFAHLPKDSHRSWASALSGGILWDPLTHRAFAIYGLCVVARGESSAREMQALKSKCYQISHFTKQAVFFFFDLGFVATYMVVYNQCLDVKH